VKKAELIDSVKNGRAALLTAIAGLPDDALLRPFAIGIWSVKDLLAHLTAWESELITALAGLGRPGSVPHLIEIEDFDEFNEDQYRVNVRRPLDIIQEDFANVHRQLILSIERLDEKLLNDRNRFAWMEGEPIWTLIEDTATLHEQEHAQDVLRWRAENGLRASRL